MHDSLQNTRSLCTNLGRLIAAKNELCLVREGGGFAIADGGGEKKRQTTARSDLTRTGLHGSLLLRLRKEMKTPQGVFMVTCLWNLAQFSQHRGPFKGYL